MRQTLLQGLAHPLDQPLEHPYLGGQLLGALQGVAGDGLDQAADPLMHVGELVCQDQVGFAQVGEFGLHLAVGQVAGDQAVQGEQKPEHADQAGEPRAPSAAAPPKEERRRQGQAKVGAGQQRPGDSAHNPARPNQPKVSTGSGGQVEGNDAAGFSGLRETRAAYSAGVASRRLMTFLSAQWLETLLRK